MCGFFFNFIFVASDFSGSEKEEDQGKIPEVTSSASRGRAAARSLTPANKRHDSSSDSDTVKTR